MILELRHGRQKPGWGLRQKDSAEHERYDGALNLRKGYLKTTPSTH